MESLAESSSWNAPSSREHGFSNPFLWGGAHDFILINEPYRFPRADWLNYEAPFGYRAKRND